MEEDRHMLIVACQKCGELKVLAGAPDASGVAHAVWTCQRCGAGQVMEITVSKDVRRGDLRKILGGLALSAAAHSKTDVCAMIGEDEDEEGFSDDER